MHDFQRHVKVQSVKGLIPPPSSLAELTKRSKPTSNSKRRLPLHSITHERSRLPRSRSLPPHVTLHAAGVLSTCRQPKRLQRLTPGVVAFGEFDTQHAPQEANHNVNRLVDKERMATFTYPWTHTHSTFTQRAAISSPSHVLKYG